MPLNTNNQPLLVTTGTSTGQPYQCFDADGYATGRASSLLKLKTFFSAVHKGSARGEGVKTNRGIISNIGCMVKQKPK